MVMIRAMLCFVMGLAISPLLMANEPNALQPAPSNQEISPTPEMILHDGILSLTKRLKQGGNQEDILIFLNQEIATHFDFGYMARLVAGHYWNALNEEKRSAFQKHFQLTFFQALGQQLSNLGNPQIQFYPARPGTNLNEITVSARVTQPQGIPILMDFRFYRENQGWKIFDVVADGSSAVLYYRRWYAELVGRYGIDSLLNSN